jgi:hypothetical protein
MVLCFSGCVVQLTTQGSSTKTLLELELIEARGFKMDVAAISFFYPLAAMCAEVNPGAPKRKRHGKKSFFLSPV